MQQKQPNNPLHGVKLETVVTELVDHFGWQTLAERININCFKSDPSVKSSLKFLRKTPWARDKVEALYLATLTNSFTKTAAATRNKTNRSNEETAQSPKTAQSKQTAQSGKTAPSDKTTRSKQASPDDSKPKPNVNPWGNR